MIKLETEKLQLLEDLHAQRAIEVTSRFSGRVGVSGRIGVGVRVGLAVGSHLHLLPRLYSTIDRATN